MLVIETRATPAATSAFTASRARLQTSCGPACTAIGSRSRGLSMTSLAAPHALRTLATLEGTALDFPEFIMKKIPSSSPLPAWWPAWLAGAAVRTNLLGDPANPEQAQRTIVITPTTRYVNVTKAMW